jgi:uncharacterized protein (DUF1330 family)
MSRPTPRRSSNSARNFFPSYKAALDRYHSPDYQKAKALRIGTGVGEIVFIQGYDGPQP